MAEDQDFQVIFGKLDEARAALGEPLTVRIETLQQQSESISELMLMARELAEPGPSFFSRG